MPEADERPSEAEHVYDPSIPTRHGQLLSNDDLLASRGTGRSGPHDIGTRPDDAPPSLGAELGGPGSPTSRLWEELERDVKPRPAEPPPAPGPEVELPTPPDNPGGPPPASE